MVLSALLCLVFCYESVTDGLIAIERRSMLGTSFAEHGMVITINVTNRSPVAMPLPF
jgi:hypothetical protein